MRKLGIIAFGICILVAPFGTDCGERQSVVPLPPPVPPTPPEPVLVLNSDPASRHIARGTASDGTRYDYWVQRSEEGEILYLSDLRASLPNGSEYYFQWDAITRPTFVRGPEGTSVRVHFYLQDGRADVTITLPDGQSQRGILDLPSLMGAGPHSRAPASLSKDALGVDVAEGQTIGNRVADFCAAVNEVRAPVCFAGGNVIGALVSVGACAASVGLAGLVPVLAPGAVAVCGLAANPTVWEVAGAATCEGLRIGLDYCQTALQDPLDEPDPPVPPSETGTVVIGTGAVHVTLTWDNATDVDLHVTDPSGEEIYFGHPGSASGGRLDVDDIDGYGPENIFWPQGGAPAGQYVVEVVYYSSHGRGSSNYQVVVRRPGPGGGQVVEEYSGSLSSRGERHTITSFAVGAGA